MSDRGPPVVELTAEQRRRQRQRNIALAVALVLFVLLLYAVSFVKGPGAAGTGGI